MTSDIVIIVVLAIILIVLLRHWPETTTAAPKQQINARKPLEESEQRRREGREARLSWWQRLLRSGRTVAGSFVRLFSDKSDRQPAGTAPLPAAKPTPVEEPDEVAALLTRAEAAQRKGEYSRAEEDLVKAAVLEPTNPRIYSKLGILYLEEGENWPEAEEAFAHALEYDKKNGYLHNNLGLVLYNQDKFAAATREYEAAILLDDAVASRHVNLGLAFMALRQFAKAESAFKRAVKLDPTNAEYLELANEATAKKRSHTR